MLPDCQLDWQPYIREFRDKSVGAIINHGAAVYEFSRWCEDKSGGSMFSSLMEAWFGMSRQTASKWCTIGRKKSELLHTMQQLPPSMGSIYMLCTIGEVPDHITPESTQKDITKAMKDIANLARAKEGYRSPNMNQEAEDALCAHRKAEGAKAWERLREEREAYQAYKKELLNSPVYTLEDALRELGMYPPTKETLCAVKKLVVNKHHPDREGGCEATFKRLQNAVELIQRSIK